MKRLSVILLICAISLFGAVGTKTFGFAPATSEASELSRVGAVQIEISSAAEVHTAVGHVHDHEDNAGSSADTNCSSLCCTFGCHFVTIDLRRSVQEPDFSYDPVRPVQTPLLAGKQPPGPERPPRIA
jgi:hypothetical protein